MSVYETLYRISDEVLFFPFMLILIGSIILSIKTRFIQIRAFPRMFKLLFARSEASSDKHTIKARNALFTAMSTTIGIGNIVSPIIAIGFGGPGALIGFVLATIFGGAATFVEVIFSLHYRKRYADGSIAGGPMQYLKEAMHPGFSVLYAISGMALLAAWSGAQANQLAILLQPTSAPRALVGVVVAVIILFLLIGGIKRIGQVAEKLVPLMFLLYTSAMCWIMYQNLDKIPAAMFLVWDSFFTLRATGGAMVGLGFQRALRWGLGRGIQANEAGVGTASIAHAVAETDNPFNQAILALVSVYTNGILCLLSGFSVLVTGLWLDPTLSFDISMMNAALSMYFSTTGTVILIVSGVLFSFSTILGNSYYGTQCFLYATKNRYVYVYYCIISLCVFWGAISDVKFVWSIIDFFILPVAIPHIIGIVILAFKKGHLLVASESK